VVLQTEVSEAADASTDAKVPGFLPVLIGRRVESACARPAERPNALR
jgi:hypothetical protein